MTAGIGRFCFPCDRPVILKENESMCKCFLALALALALMLPCAPALASGIGTGASSANSTLLMSLTHNCPNTGIMLPDTFSPYQTTYLLTVASWVSRPTFTPTAYDPNATITVNGQVVRSGEKSQVIPLSNKPQAVTIVVSNGGASTTYTIYIQRRPSERRTRVSSGYISEIYQTGNTWRINADLVTVQFAGDDYNNGNRSSFRNPDKDNYDYAVATNCYFYYGTKANCYRAANIYEFKDKYLTNGSTLYTIVYIEDEIVAIFPYDADY